MRERLEQRLQELRGEFETGQRMLGELEQQRLGLEKTLLRISGAIQVLEEELEKDPQDGTAPEVMGSQAANGRHAKLALPEIESGMR